MMKVLILNLLQGCETWVLTDCTSGDLMLHRGQQVEVLGPAPTNPHMVTVKLLGSAQEGPVPVSCLKQPVGGFKFKNGLGGGLANEGRSKL